MRKYADKFFRDISAVGSNYLYSVIGLGFLIFGETGVFWKLLIGAALGYFIMVPIRYFFFKERPTPKMYSNIAEKIMASAFPSAHAMKIVLMSLIMNEFFVLELASYGFGLLAILVCYSRIYLKKHDYTDIIGGAVLGIVVYFLIGMIL
jgi:undecaprenyl-diphosphatase